MSILTIEHINEFDTLNAGREKINKHAIDPANRAELNAIDAKNVANQSNQTSQSAEAIAINTDDRLDNMLGNELQDGEVVDARKPFGEEAFPNLGKRLDDSDDKLSNIKQNVDNKFKKIIHMTDYVVSDGVTDVTNLLQQVLNDNIGKTIYWDNNGETYITRQLTIPTNTHIVFSPTTKIRSAEGYGTHERVFNLSKVDNVVIEGNFAEIRMNKGEYLTGEHRHCMTIFGCHNIKINNLLLCDSGGDGIIIGGATDSSRLSQNIFIYGVTCDNNRRQGISVVGGVDGLYIDDCLFKNTGGTLPGFGLDIEPNDGVLDNRNIFVTNCGFENNVGGMFGVYNNSYNVILNGLYVISGTQSAAVTRAKVTDKNPTVKILNSVISTLGVSNVSNLRLIDNEIKNMVIEGVHSQCFDIQVIRCHFSKVLLDNLSNSLFTKNIVKDTETTAVSISKTKNIDVTENYLENCGSETTNPMSIVTTSKSRITKNVFRKNNKLNKNCIVLNGGSNTGTIIEDNDFTNGCSEKEIGTPGPESVIGVNTLKNGEKSYHISTYLFAQTHAWLGRKMVAERTGLPFTLYECIQTGQNTFSWKAIT